MATTVATTPISGFPEWLPDKRLVEKRMIDVISTQFELFGFAPIETSAVERMEVLQAKGGIERQIYAVGRPAELEDEDIALGLHFDLTVPLARYVTQHADRLVFPFRRYQIQKVWRGERPQRGRFREFYQCDIDVIGRRSLDLIHDAEIPCVINTTFDALRIPEFRVHVATRRIWNEVFDALRIDQTQGKLILRAIDKFDRAPDEAERALQQASPAQRERDAVLALVRSSTFEEAEEQLAELSAPRGGIDALATVVDGAVALGMPRDRIRPDFSIARGLDYYTGTVYETFVDGRESWGSICSGGRYDDLATYFTTQKFPGVGISIGLTRLLDLLIASEYVTPSAQTPTEVLVTMIDRDRYMRSYLSLADSLRQGGLKTEVYLESQSLRDQISYASAKGIATALIAGPREFEADVVVVRDLRHHTEQTVTGDEVVRYVKTLLEE